MMLRRIVVNGMVGALMAPTMLFAQQPFDLDPSFVTNIHETNVNSVLPRPDGSLIVSGKMEIGGSGPISLARLDAAGNRDLSFGTVIGGGGQLLEWNNWFYAMNGAIVRRIDFDGNWDPNFITMSSDPHFSPVQGGDYHVYPDGRILMSGSHIVNDTAHGFSGLYDLIWFTNTGHLDTSQLIELGALLLRYPDGLVGLTTEEFEDLDLLAFADGAYGSAFAWGALLGLGETDDLPPAMIPPEFRSSWRPKDKYSWDVNGWLTAYPNPASDRVMLTFPKEAKGATLEVFDSQGALVHSVELNSETPFVEIQTRAWAEGLYLGTLNFQGLKAGEAKFTVIR